MCATLKVMLAPLFPGAFDLFKVSVAILEWRSTCTSGGNSCSKCIGNCSTFNPMTLPLYIRFRQKGVNMENSARLTQLVRSLTTNQKVPGSILVLVES